MLIWVLCFTCAASYSRPGSVSRSDSGLLVRSHIYCSPCNGNVSNNPTSEEGPAPCCQGRKEGLITSIWFPDNNMGRNWPIVVPVDTLWTSYYHERGGPLDEEVLR